MGNLLSTPVSELWATLAAMNKLGVTSHHCKKLRSDPEYACKVLALMLRDSRNGIPPGLVEALMGREYFGTQGWNTVFGEQFPEGPSIPSEHVAEGIIKSFPWNDEVLNSPCPFFNGQRIRDTHFAFLGLSQLHGKPLTILHWHEITNGNPLVTFMAEDLKLKESHFVRAQTCDLRWYLSLREPVPFSGGKTWEGQEALLPPEYEVPSAVCEITKIVLYYRIARTRPYIPDGQTWNEFGIRCWDEIHPNPRCATIRMRKGFGNFIEATSPRFANRDLMLAATRKLPPQFKQQSM
jgi:hypothetical protein